RDNAIMGSLGMRGLQFHENMVERQLANHGVRVGDVRYILHTHLHIDHAGKDDVFPMNTTVVINRRELEYSVSGLMHPQYPKPDILHLVERLHTPGALRLEDLDMAGPIELLPGIVLENADGHTEGSMNVHVETADGRATICGDVIYDFNDQIIEPQRTFGPEEYQVTGNHSGSKRREKAAMRKLMHSGAKYILPVHDKPAKVEGGRVVGRLDMAIPGPVSQSVPRRDWFPA
ncbi:MAG: MBL fold metallo-hydrolase, partial [Gemmobacter sp.]